MVWKFSIRCCPDVSFGLFMHIIVAWLSTYNDIFFPIVSGEFLMIHTASMAPTTSASNVLCFVGGPRYILSDFTGVARPFLYSIAAAPIPSSCPEPSENIL